MLCKFRNIWKVFFNLKRLPAKNKKVQSLEKVFLETLILWQDQLGSLNRCCPDVSGVQILEDNLAQLERQVGFILYKYYISYILEANLAQLQSRVGFIFYNFPPHNFWGKRISVNNSLTKRILLYLSRFLRRAVPYPRICLSQSMSCRGNQSSLRFYISSSIYKSVSRIVINQSTCM